MSEELSQRIRKFMEDFVSKDNWREFLLLMDAVDTEARKDIVKYGRENGIIK
jgi:hypothetical protein